MSVLTNTFWIALLATLACLVVGYPYAYLMTIVPGRIAGLLLIAVLLPFWSSLLVRTFAWQVLLRDTGVINRFLLDLGLINEPLALIRTTGGVIIGMIQQISDNRIGSEWTPAVVFAFLVLIMVLRPEGLLGEQTRTSG